MLEKTKFFESRNVNLRRIAHSCIILLCLISAYAPLSGQDIHYSQFYNAPYVMNPGLTGVFREDARFMLNYRSQWQSVAEYKTFSVAADMKIWPKQPRDGFFSVALTLNRDQAGLSKLTLVDIGLNGSYTHRLSDNAFLTFGARGAFDQRTFNLSNVLFDRQYDSTKGLADPALSNGESAFNESNLFFSMGAGINLRLQALSNETLVDELKKRTKLDLGVGFTNLNRPDQSFENASEAKLPIRVSPYLMSVVQLGDESSDWDLVVNAAVQFQQKYREALAMAGVRYHIDRTPGKQVALELGANYRFFRIGDALTPTMQLFYNNWRLGLSWDINISEFNVATNSNGGPEIALIYAFSKVKRPPFRTCRLM